MKEPQKKVDKEDIRTGTSPEILAQALLDNLYYMQGRTPELATRNEWYMALAYTVRDRIKEHFNHISRKVEMKYIDPSYTIRSLPANARDSAFCLLLGQNAVHAGMAGKTDMVVGNWNHQATHAPFSLAVSQPKKLDPEGWLWHSVLATTGQPYHLV